MSTLDLTEAIKAARAVRLTDDDIFFNLDDQEHVFLGTASATDILAAAAPLIARQVADSIAAEIEAQARFEGVRAQRVIHMCSYAARNWSPA